MSLPVKTEFKSRADFLEQLKYNPGLIIIKFGADWCGPCKRIEQNVIKWFNIMPKNVQCYMIDVDTCFDIYAYLKRQKFIKTIPTILCYYKDNLSYVPDLSISDSDNDNVNLFFTKCLQDLNAK